MRSLLSPQARARAAVLVISLALVSTVVRAHTCAFPAPVLAGCSVGMSLDAVVQLFPTATVVAREAKHVLSVRTSDPMPGVSLGEGLLEVTFNEAMIATEVWFSVTPIDDERGIRKALKKAWGPPDDEIHYDFLNREGGFDGVTNVTWSKLCGVSRQVNISEKGRPVVTSIHVGLIGGSK